MVLVPVVLLLGFVTSDDAIGAVGPQDGGALRPDAPIPAAWVPWVNRAGAVCKSYTPALVAAQIETESGWDPLAVAQNPASNGGDAMGLGQFQAGTWASWGRDADGDGGNSPLDPEDAITAMGALMCDLVSWANSGIRDGDLHGDPLDVALAAYNCGRGCVSRHGGVPASGQAHDYPPKVRSKVSRYAATPVQVIGGWTMPLPRGRYDVGSPFGPRGGRLHAGVDLIARKGTPIFAASAGVVARVVCDDSTAADTGTCDVDGSPSVSGCGWFVEIRHANNITTRYCHQLRRPIVTVGQRVAAGQQIGVVGTSGHSSGPHLHFEVHTGFPAHNSNAINPIPFLRAAGVNP